MFIGCQRGDDLSTLDLSAYIRDLIRTVNELQMREIPFINKDCVHFRFFFQIKQFAPEIGCRVRVYVSVC